MLRTIILGGYLLVVTLITLEVGVRLWGYSERHIYDPIYMRFEQTEEISYVHKPNLVHARARGLAVINTDSLGLRSKTAGLRYGPKQENEYRIAIVADSITFGEGIPATEDTFAQVVEETLNQKQTAVEVRVFNYGASAYSVKEMAATLRYRMLDIEPDIVVMAIVAADFNLTRTPGVDGSGYMVDPTLARINLLNSTARRIMRSLRLAYVLREITYSRLLTRPNVVGSRPADVLPGSYSYIQRFKETAETRGVPYIILLLPMRQTGFLDRVSTQLRHDGIAFVDLSSLSNEFTREQFMASRFDAHPSAAVHRRIGHALADHILSSQGGSSRGRRAVGP